MIYYNILIFQILYYYLYKNIKNKKIVIIKFIIFNIKINIKKKIIILDELNIKFK